MRAFRHHRDDLKGGPEAEWVRPVIGADAGVDEREVYDTDLMVIRRRCGMDDAKTPVMADALSRGSSSIRR